MYEHIKRDQRAALAALLRAGLSQKEVAEELGVDQGTVSRELVRNADHDGRYDARSASKKARERRSNSRKKTRVLENDTNLACTVESLLKLTLAPEQIAQKIGGISHRAIYAWIKRSRPDLKKYLRRRGKKRRRYGTSQVPSRYQAAKRPLTERPVCVENRSRLGDWEGDTARGGDRISALLVYADRKSRFIIAEPLERATAEVVRSTTKKMLRGKPLHTITFDNGSEFALWQFMEIALRIKIYFARPGHPEERGTGENSIGLLREFFPKGTCFSKAMKSAASKAVWLINHRPRKCLGWRTSCEVFGACCT